MKKEEFMLEALKEAELAKEANEIPVGTVIVKNDTIISRGHNLRESLLDITSHAEIEAIRSAATYLKDWRLEGCDLYVTLEPCPMCAGTILQARIKKVFFGAYNHKNGSASSILNILNYPGLDWQTDIESGVLAYQCQKILDDFFSTKRHKNNLL